MGLGYFLVEYRVDFTGSYDIAITLDHQHYLRKLVNRDESTIGTSSDSLQQTHHRTCPLASGSPLLLSGLTAESSSAPGTLGYPIWSYGDMFQVEVGPAPLSAQFSTATGAGLLGGVTNENRVITILGRDAFGNIKWDSDDSAGFKLKVTKCSGGASVYCDSETLVQSADSLTGGTTTSELASVSTVTAVAGSPGQYEVCTRCRSLVKSLCEY
jgi:hypothetical protein